MISSNLDFISHRLATIHPRQTTTNDDDDGQTDDNHNINSSVT